MQNFDIIPKDFMKIIVIVAFYNMLADNIMIFRIELYIIYMFIFTNM